MDHPEIPSGLYCYKRIKIDYGESDTLPKWKTEICPHWQRTEKGARCNLINEEHHTYCCHHLVWDQVKECNVNMDRDYTPVKKTDEELQKEGFKLVDITCECGKDMKVWQKRYGNRKRD